MNFAFCIILHTKTVGVPHTKQGPTHPYSQYHDCWWPGEARSHAITNNDGKTKCAASMPIR